MTTGTDTHADQDEPRDSPPTGKKRKDRTHWDRCSSPTRWANPLAIGEQLSLLVFMTVASKGAAGVSGAGLATLAAGLQSHRPELLDGIGLIVGIDKFMSEARALTNFSGNAIATVLIGAWTHTWDSERMAEVLNEERPFDEQTMVDDHSRNTDETEKPPTEQRQPAGASNSERGPA